MKTLRIVTALAGAGIIGYGAYGLLHDPFITDPLQVLLWAVGGVLLHDGVWLPLVLLAGALLAPAPRVLRGGLVVAAALTAVALPAVLRQGQGHGNPTVLALPYLRNWLLLLALVAVLTALLALAGWFRRQRRAGRWSRRPRRASRRSPG